MSVMDKFLSSIKFGDEDMDEDDFDGYDDEDEEFDEPPKKKTVTKAETDFEEEKEKQKPKLASKVTPLRQVRKTTANGMEVCVIKPTTTDDSREITDTLLQNRTVVLNLEGLDIDIAQRIIDFTSGSCYAIGGNLQKISHYILIITPPSVDISGDFQDFFSGSFDVSGFTGL